MCNFYDRDSCLERLAGIKGVVLIRQESNEAFEVTANAYEGVNGDMVIVDTTDDEYDEYTMNGYLIELGLADLIGSFLPPLPPQITAEQEPDWELANSFLGRKTRRNEKHRGLNNQSLFF